MKKLIFVLTIGVIILLSIYFSIDADAAEPSGVHYEKLDLPLVDYLNYDDFFRAYGSFNIVKSLPEISPNLAKVIGYSNNDRSDIRIHPGYVEYFSYTQGASVVLDFAELPPGTYTFRYYKEKLFANHYCSFVWRTNESMKWVDATGAWERPDTFTIKKGDRFQVKLYNYNGEWYGYRMYFYIVPVTDTTSLTPEDIKTEPYYNQIGKVYHVGRDYYQVVDEQFSEYYNDYSALSRLGEYIVAPNSDYMYYKIYQTFQGKWRILWRGEDTLTNPLIYENGLFYVQEPSSCYYSEKTFDSFSEALVALTSENTKYKFDAIRRYENALSYEALEFFDVEYSEIFWNVYTEDIYDSSFYWNLNREHYWDLSIQFPGDDISKMHWRLPAVFTFQNYSETYTEMPIEFQVSTFGLVSDVGSFVEDSVGSFSGWVSSTTSKIYCAAEKTVSTVVSSVKNGVSSAVTEVKSFWKDVGNGAETFVTEIVTEGEEIIGDIKDVVYEEKENLFDTDWLNDIKDMFVPDRKPYEDIFALFKDKFYFITDMRGIVESFLQLFSSTYSTRAAPPVIYADFAESESQYFQGIGQVAVVDFSWYARYKPYVDTFLSAVLWGFFMFSLYLRLPDIISGVGSGLGSFGGWTKGTISAKESKSRRRN